MATFLRSFVEAIAPGREIPSPVRMRLKRKRGPKLPNLVVVLDLDGLRKNRGNAPKLPWNNLPWIMRWKWRSWDLIIARRISKSKGILWILAVLLTKSLLGGLLQHDHRRQDH